MFLNKAFDMFNSSSFIPLLLKSICRVQYDRNTYFFLAYVLQAHIRYKVLDCINLWVTKEIPVTQDFPSTLCNILHAHFCCVRESGKGLSLLLYEDCTSAMHKYI